MKIHPLGEKSLNVEGKTERRTDTLKLNVAFHNFDQKRNNILKIYKWAAKILPFLQAEIVSDQNTYKRSPLVDTEALNSEYPKFIYYVESQPF
jgi:hypothetical protein